MREQDPEENGDSERFFGFGEGEGSSEEGEPNPFELHRILATQEGWQGEVERALERVLKDTPKVCPHCETICEHHAIVLRDAFLARAQKLAEKLSQGITVYRACRKYGIAEPSSVIIKLYEVWQELFILYPMAEPQEQDELLETLQELLEQNPPEEDEGA